jgi:hypothetical protein
MILRAADGADVATIPASVTPGLEAAALGADGTVVFAGLRHVDVWPSGAEPRQWPLKSERFGVSDVAALDDAGRVVIGTRAGDVVLMDLATGAGRTVLQMQSPICSVGFHRGAPWALDAGGRLRFLGEGGASSDLGLSTPGGLLGPGGAWIALGDDVARAFRVRTLPDGQEVFATTPGFAAEAVGVDAEGKLWVASEDRLLVIDPEAGKIKKAGAGASEILRLGDGTMLFLGATARALAPGADKPVALAKSADDAAVAGGRLFVMIEQTAEIWDLAAASRSFRLDLRKTWLGERSEALRLVHLGSDGRPWIHMSDGHVYRADALDDEETCHVGRLDPDGALWLHPDGATLYRVHERTITPIAIDGFVAGPPVSVAIDAEPSKLVFSPSGRRLAIFHRDGRLSSIDLRTGRAVAIATGKTSAAERAPHELFMTDLLTPHGCAFGASEQTIAWTRAGGITFADADTGAVLGQLGITTAGTEWVVTDGVAIDGSKVRVKKPPSREIVVLEGGEVLDAATVLARRGLGVLAKLTR